MTTTIWLTGLSGSGKTTTAEALAAEMKKHAYAVECIDGDWLRQQFAGQLGFGRDDRFRNVQRAVDLCKQFERQGLHTIVSMISPYREMRAFARKELDSFIEVYVSCPLEECERRDVKGLYAKARRGEIRNFTGISDPYEEPEQPEITIDTYTTSLQQNVQEILKYVVLPYS